VTVRRVVQVLVVGLAAAAAACHDAPPTAPPALANTARPVVAPPGARPDPATAEQGRKVFEHKGCIGCHSTDGTPKVGPSLAHYFGSTLKLDDGTTAVADEARFRARLLHPRHGGQAGYNYVGPSYEGQIKAREIDALIAYVRTLR
jgi:mono/diheme cytochrome c family protein